MLQPVKTVSSIDKAWITHLPSLYWQLAQSCIFKDKTRMWHYNFFNWASRLENGSLPKREKGKVRPSVIQVRVGGHRFTNFHSLHVLLICVSVLYTDWNCAKKKYFLKTRLSAKAKAKNVRKLAHNNDVKGIKNCKKKCDDYSYFKKSFILIGTWFCPLIKVFEAKWRLLRCLFDWPGFVSHSGSATNWQRGVKRHPTPVPKQ